MGLLILGCLGMGLVVSTAITGMMRRVAPRIGLMDQPAARKVHTLPTPLGGGIGILAGVIVPLVLVQGLAWILVDNESLRRVLPAELLSHLPGFAQRSTQLWLIVLAGVAISMLGFFDDRRAMRWQPKLAVQALVACLLVAGGVRGTLFVQAPWLGWCMTFLWIVVLTNAFNFLDNMDGLSGGIGLIVSVVFASIMLTGTANPHWFVAAFLLILAGSLAGFLMHNWPPAKIFMGDSGSCLIGVWIAALTIVGTFYDYRRTGSHVILAPLFVLAVPLYDFTSVVLIRLSQGRSPFHADKCHFSHRLVEMGLSRRHAVLTIYLVTLATGLAGLLLYQVEGWIGASLIAALVFCTLAVIAILEMAGRVAATGASAGSSNSSSSAPHSHG
jgi:UDP-GlcNAc:undecaprenyl-phosphate/decaprenyl-phosphate GlcNAc-1-phosphate transferase